MRATVRSTLRDGLPLPLQPPAPLRELVRKLAVLLSPRERWQAVALFGLMLGGTLLELVGVGAVPAVVMPRGGSAEGSGAYETPIRPAGRMPLPL